MSTIDHQPELPPAIRRVLDAVRRRIRAYVWIEGLAIIVVAGRPGVLARAGGRLDCSSRRSTCAASHCSCSAPASLYVAYRYLLRRDLRADFRLQPAVLLERRFPNLRDHVLTAVDVAAPRNLRPDVSSGAMFATHGRRLRAIAGIDAGAGLQSRPIDACGHGRRCSRGIDRRFSPRCRATRSASGCERIALSEEPWPRRVHLEVVGFPPDADRQPRSQAGPGRRFRAAGPRPHRRLTKCRTKWKFASGWPMAAAAATR